MIYQMQCNPDGMIQYFSRDAIRLGLAFDLFFEKIRICTVAARLLLGIRVWNIAIHERIAWMKIKAYKDGDVKGAGYKNQQHYKSA
jgi:hypothetical protein